MFFGYESDPTKENFSGGANITKIALKRWQFSKKLLGFSIDIFGSFLSH